MKRRINILALALLMPILMIAQTDADALRYSFLNFGGTARSLGSGNAYGAIGGDFSSTSMNPAGLGIYRSGEFIITPGLSIENNSSTYFGELNQADETDFQLNNVSVVFSQINEGKENSEKAWIGANFGIGYNKLMNYNSETYYSGFNNEHSLTDVYTAFLNGVDPTNAYDSDPFGAGLAWETFLLNPNLDDSNSYYSVINGGNIQQSKFISQEGSLDELTISFAGNYGNKLYVGGTIGVPFIDYYQASTYSENDINDVHSEFASFDYTNEFSTSGTGVNLKLGFIYRISDIVRVGGAFHSPTLYQMHDSYFSTMQSSLDASGDYSFDSPFGEYDYELVTPWRVIGSAAVFIKKFGFISMDYEFVDYSESNFNYGYAGSTGINEAENNVNQSIDTKYGGASNIRIGAEAVADIFRFRGGYILQGSPFASGISEGDSDQSASTYTAGIGIKEEHFFIDLGFGHTVSNSFEAPYVLTSATNNSGATIEKSKNQFLLSLGFRF